MKGSEDFICIYCKQEIFESSVSHVIPDFIGGALELRDAVCKTCNNRINREIEEPIKTSFAYLRSGLDLRGRRRREVKVPAKVRILGQELEVWVSPEFQIPPFEYRKPNGEKGLVIVGERNYVEEEKRKIDSNTRTSWKWEDLEGPPTPDILIEILPIEILKGDKGQRLAAKIAFERFCQLRSASSLVDDSYDHVRWFVIDSNARGIFSKLFFDDKVMNRNFNIPFPWHGIFLMQRGYQLISIVTLFGLFYFLIVLSTRMSIIANWEGCILLHPQTKQVYEPILRGSLFPIVPATAFNVNNDTCRKAAQYALAKFDKALKEARTMTIIGEKQA